MQKRDPNEPESGAESGRESGGFFGRPIPIKWILAVVVAYMVIYNLILFLNNR